MSGLKRYTELPYLLHMLSTRQITLLNPASWQDRNDAYFLKRYVERRDLQSVHVMCLSTAAATFHHWHVFAHGPSGVRIEFDEPLFYRWANGIDGARIGPVRYLKKEIDARIAVDDLPFTKRHAFRDEGEVRLLVDCVEAGRSVLPVAFELEMIKKITLSPWLAPTVVPSIQEAIRHAAGGASLRITRTSMLESEPFMDLARRDT